MSYALIDGYIVLNGRTLFLSQSEEDLFKKNVLRWTVLASSFSQKYGVPLGWILSIIWAESGGNPNALRVEPDGETGVGLMQITNPALKRGLSDAQVFVPETNLDIGVKFVASFHALDLPSAASCFNCGCGSDGRPKPAPTENPTWGICAARGYLERVSSAFNSFLRMTPPASAGRNLGVALFATGAAGLAAYYLLR